MFMAFIDGAACIRSDGVVGYHVCLTFNVHRRSSVRTWVASVFDFVRIFTASVNVQLSILLSQEVHCNGLHTKSLSLQIYNPPSTGRLP